MNILISINDASVTIVDGNKEYKYKRSKSGEQVNES